MKSPEPYREERPWGAFIEFTRNAQSTVKIITVNPNESLSLQYHHNRDEFWHVISGEGILEIGTDKKRAVIGADYFVPKGTRHRISAGNLPLALLEISYGAFDENDIVRLEDKYGRIGSTEKKDPAPEAK